MLFWRHWKLHRDIVQAGQPWTPGETHTCWICGKQWRADMGNPGFLHVSKPGNNKAPR
jgi:hypothetical protein